MSATETTQMLKDMGFKIPDNHATLSSEELIDAIVKDNDEELTDEKWAKLGEIAFNKLFQDMINSPCEKVKVKKAKVKK